MANTVLLPEDFSNYLSVENAALRFKEAAEVAEKITAKGVELYPNLDHAAIFTDPPYLVAGPLKQLGVRLRLGCALLSFAGGRLRLYQCFRAAPGGKFRPRQGLVRLCGGGAPRG